MAYSGRSRTSSEGSEAFSTTWPATTTLPPLSFRERRTRLPQEQMEERALSDSRKMSLRNGRGRGAGRCRTCRSRSTRKRGQKNLRPLQKASWIRRAEGFELYGPRVWTHLEQKVEKSHWPEAEAEDPRDSSISRTLSSPRYFPNRHTTSSSTGALPTAVPALALVD